VAAVQQRQVTGNTHVFDRPRSSASVSSSLLTELNTTLNCLKVRDEVIVCLCVCSLSSVFAFLQDVGITGASGDLAQDDQCGMEEVLQHTLRICRCIAATPLSHRPAYGVCYAACGYSDLALQDPCHAGGTTRKREQARKRGARHTHRAASGGLVT
jgi:hypothetical protein